MHLKSLTNLEELYLDDTQITGAGLEHLKDLTKLKRLGLQNTQITDAGLVNLKGLTSLERLNAGDTHISDVGLVHLKDLTNLTSLTLKSHASHWRRCQDSPAGITKLHHLPLGFVYKLLFS